MRTPAATPRFAVKYYDADLGRKGRGIQWRTFIDSEEAATFARANKLYGKPAEAWSLDSDNRAWPMPAAPR